MQESAQSSGHMPAVSGGRIWEASKEAFLWRFLAATMPEAVNESRDAKLYGIFLASSQRSNWTLDLRF